MHAYLGYDPRKFGSPAAPSDSDGLADAAMEHMLRFGGSRPLTEEELAEAIEIDPSQIAGLGPSLESLVALLEERKRRILETYDPKPALDESIDRFRDAAALTPGPPRPASCPVADRGRAGSRRSP